MTAIRLYVVLICDGQGYHIVYTAKLHLQLGIDLKYHHDQPETHGRP